MTKEQVSSIKEKLSDNGKPQKALAKPKTGVEYWAGRERPGAYDLGAAGRRRNTHPIGGMKVC